MIKLVPYTPAHLSRFIPKGEFQDLRRDLSDAHIRPSVNMLTLLRGEEVVCIAGVNKQREGAGEVWLIPGVLVDRYKLEFYKAVKKVVAFCHLKLGFHRLEMAVNISTPYADKWAKNLGFEFEGIARFYDSIGNDCKIYSSVLEVEGVWQQEQ